MSSFVSGFMASSSLRLCAGVATGWFPHLYAVDGFKGAESMMI
jgi:hypothetical protein